MNTPKILFLEIKFLRIALKSQHSLTETVLQNRQEIDLLIPRRDLSYPGHVNLKLTNVPTSPCYAILMMLMIIQCTVNCLTCFVSAQVNQLQHAVPVQQRYKTTADHGKYHTTLDTAIRTLRIETSKRGRTQYPSLSQFSRK